MKCVIISKYEKIKTKNIIKNGKGNFVPLYRDVLLGLYVQQPNEVLNAIGGELNCDIETGTKIVLEVVELTEDEYNQLPEFRGY